MKIVTAYFLLPFVQLNAFSLSSRKFSAPDRVSFRSWGTVANERTSLRSTRKIDIESEKTVALQALKKLLARQLSEVKETERMLQRFSNQEGNIAQGDDERIEGLATSILSGVDYGFVSRSEGASFGKLNGGFPVGEANVNSAPFEGYGPPANIWSLASQQFLRNLNAIFGEYKDEGDGLMTLQRKELREKLEQLTLNSTAIWEREMAPGPIEAPLILKIPYISLCYLLDDVFEGHYVFGRFFLLETVARMPYFSYITMLHLYETLGFWRRSSDVKRIHFAEEWNEYHHLLIMESLGGDQKWWVRFLAQHSAVVYFLVLCLVWALSPTLAYKFSELLETHAVNTYGQFLDENEELLKSLPPSIEAVNYYSIGASDPFFGEYQTTALSAGTEVCLLKQNQSHVVENDGGFGFILTPFFLLQFCTLITKQLRRPGDSMQSLFDVFSAIKADEGDHVGTMKSCLDPEVAVKSPALEKKVLVGAALVSAFTYFISTGDILDILDIPQVSDAVVADFFSDATGIASQLAKDESEGDFTSVGADLMEDGSVGALIKYLSQNIMPLLESLGKLL